MGSHGTTCKHQREYWQECGECELERLESEKLHITPEEYSRRIWDAYPIKDLNINALGLCGEAGEFANKLKKRLYREVPDVELVDELGDVLWHVAQCARLLGVSLEHLMLRSVAKTEVKNRESK